MSSVADLGIFRHSVGFLLIELVPQWLVVVKTGRLCFHLTHAVSLQLFRAFSHSHAS